MTLDGKSEGEDKHGNNSERGKEIYRDPMAANREADCHADNTVEGSPTSSNQDNKVETCDEDIDDGGVLCI